MTKLAGESVVGKVCEVIARRVGDGIYGVDARPGLGGALKAPAFYLVVTSFPTRTTAGKRDWTLRGVLLLGDLGEESVRQGRVGLELIPALIEGDRTIEEVRTLGGLVDDVSVSSGEEIGPDEYQQVEGWAVGFDITVMGRTR